MTINDDKNKDFSTFLAENPQILEQFKNLAPEDIKKLSQPSIVLKGGIDQLDVKLLSPKQVEQYLLMHPVIPRGVDIRSNRITSRGYKTIPASQNPQAKEAAERMKTLIDNSGGEILLNGWVKDTYAFGNGYLTLLPDKKSGEVVYLSREHPVFFRIAREKKEMKKNSVSDYGDSNGDWAFEWGDMKIDDVTKKPKAYTQVVFDTDETKVVPYGKELNADQVAHLVFDTWGDEAEGIGLVQYVQLQLKYLMNIEEAGAEGIYRSGITQKKVTTDIKNEKDLRKLAKNLENINASEAIVLPAGTNVENLIPGQGEFVNVHELLLDLIAIRLGVPKPILTLDGTDTNKATMRELMRDLIYDIHADELKIKRVVEEQIFRPACKSIYGEDFEEYPKFFFNDFDEGREERAEITNMTADFVVKFTNAYKTMIELNNIEAAQRILDTLMANLPPKDLITTDTEEDAVKVIAVPKEKPDMGVENKDEEVIKNGNEETSKEAGKTSKASEESS